MLALVPLADARTADLLNGEGPLPESSKAALILRNSEGSRPSRVLARAGAVRVWVGGCVGGRNGGESGGGG